MVVLDGAVVVGSVVVVVGSDVGATGAVGAVVVVSGGCVVVETCARVVGVVVGVGKRADAGSVDTFGRLAFGSSVAAVSFFGAAVVELVVVGAAGVVSVVVVLVVCVARCNLGAISPTVCTRTLKGLSSSCTTTKRTATARGAVVTQLHCSIRR